MVLCSKWLALLPLLWPLAALPQALPPADPAVVVVADGKDPCPIIMPAEAAGLEKKAAERLAYYLGKISGATFPVETQPAELPARAIIVGRVDPEVGKDLGAGSFLMRTAGGRLYLRGGSPAATLYAAYAFLEEIVGCRWWSHNEEDIPEKATMSAPALDLIFKPPFSRHYMYNREFLSRTNDFNFKMWGRGTESFTGSHNLYRLLTAYAKDNPEFHPLNKDGERKANKLHFCYMAPGIAEALANALGKVAEKRKGEVKRGIYFAGMGDWYGGWCQGPECTEVYADEAWTDPDGRKKPGYSATLLRMINSAAEMLEPKYPGIRVGTFAYMSLEAPPAKTVPRQNVAIRVPRLRHCTVHPAATCEKNQSYLRNLERWGQITPGGVYIWEYGASFKNFVYPFPCLRSMADNLRLYQRLGIRGVMIQGNYVTTGSDLVVLKNYVWRKLMWRPERELNAVLQDFCTGYYGPAATAMMAYVNALEDSVRQPEMVHADEFALVDKYLKPAARQQLRRRRDEAIAAAAKQEPYLRRVLEGTVGVEALALLPPTPLKEVDGRLVRANIGVDTLPRATALLSYLRNSGVNEWTSGRSNWTRFIQGQGGPLPTLEKGPVKLKVAPLWHGRVSQLYYRGKGLFYGAKSHKEKGYPALGGSMIAIGGPIMRLVGQPTTGKVAMEDAITAPGWRWSTKPSVLKTVEMADDGSVLMTAARTSRAKPGGATITTVYPLPTKATQATVQYLAKGATDWQAAVVTPEQLEAALPGELVSLKLTFPEQGCVLIDQCLAPPVKSAKLVLDPKKGTFKTVIIAGPIAFDPKTQDPPLVRRLQLLPLPE